MVASSLINPARWCHHVTLTAPPLTPCPAMPAGVGALFQQKPGVVQFVHECQSSADGGLSDTADWAAQVIQKVMAA
jgi:hypothetical protein